jgi:UDP-2,3-diacylglucosamine pyrophosphatase LpxH
MLQTQPFKSNESPHALSILVSQYIRAYIPTIQSSTSIHSMPPPTAATHRYLVVSDFHLTSGRDAVTGQWSTTEDFFWDAEFADFLNHYADGIPTTLIFNGDLFDFMQVLDMPDSAERTAFDITREEITGKHNLLCTERVAKFQVARMLTGHTMLFEALASFVGQGHEVVFLKGNHDVQLFWPAVQQRIIAILQTMCAKKRLPFLPARVQFLPWCYYIPGFLFIEHGNQYESTTAFQNFLRPLHPRDLPNGRRQLDLDVSGYLVRYITNTVEPVDPLADNVRPLSRFYAHLWKKHPLVAARAFASATVFLCMAFRKRRLWNKDEIRKRYAEICRQNAAAMNEDAHRCSPDSSVEGARIAAMFQRIRTRLHQRTAWERRVGLFLRKRSNYLPNPSRMLRARAERLAPIVGTSFIIFGHSHCADTTQVNHGTTYFNTGTWIPTFTEATPDVPDQLQFTFVRLENGRGQLYRWNPSQHLPETVTFH